MATFTGPSAAYLEQEYGFFQRIMAHAKRVDADSEVQLLTEMNTLVDARLAEIAQAKKAQAEKAAAQEE
jgi:hypothetical protein